MLTLDHHSKVYFYFFYRGSQLSTRQAYNYIDALIKDPERDVIEILPLRARKSDTQLPSSVAIHKHSLSTTSQHVPSSKASAVNFNHLKSSPPSLSHQQLQKHPSSVAISLGIKQISKASSSVQSNSSHNRLPPRMSAVTSVTTTTSAASKIIQAESTSWVSTTTVSQNVPLKRVETSPQQNDYNQIIVTKTTVSKQSSLSSSKPLPKPIGSNRPFKSAVAKETTQTTQSTKTAPSVSTSHVTTTNPLSQHNSALNSFFSQVAAQARSPMIWNEPDMTSESKDVIVTSGISQTASTSNTQCFVTTSVITHTTSPTPSISPTPSNSTSPSPSCTNEERPHLNPIGTERAHKRCSTSSVSNLPRVPAFQTSMCVRCWFES